MIPYYDGIVKRAKAICKKKNADYSEEKDPFSNFRLSEHAGLSTTEEAILMRILDKTARVIQVFRKGNRVEDETIDDTCLDLINYWVIFLSYQAVKRKMHTGVSS